MLGVVGTVGFGQVGRVRLPELAVDGLKMQGARLFFGPGHVAVIVVVFDFHPQNQVFNPFVLEEAQTGHTFVGGIAGEVKEVVGDVKSQEEVGIEGAAGSAFPLLPVLVVQAVESDVGGLDPDRRGCP